MRWYPACVGRVRGRPEVGDVVAIDRAAWVVLDMEDVPLTDEDTASLAIYRPEYRARKHPFRMRLRRLHGPAHEHENKHQEATITTTINTSHRWDIYPNGSVPLCSCCGDPWPCLITDSIRTAADSAELMDKKLERAKPGCCYSCGEIITHRQGSTTYPEPNIEIPGYPAPAFHTRQACRAGQSAYERLRATRMPDAPPVFGRAGDVVPQLWASTLPTETDEP